VENLVRAYLPASASAIPARERSRRGGGGRRQRRQHIIVVGRHGGTWAKRDHGKNTSGKRSTRRADLRGRRSPEGGAAPAAELLDLPDVAALCGNPRTEAVEGPSLVPNLGRPRPPRVAAIHHARPDHPHHPFRPWRYIRRDDPQAIRHAIRPTKGQT